VYIQYCYSSTRRTLLPTELAVPPQYWNKKDQCFADTLPAKYGDVDELNGELVRMVRLAEDIVSFGLKSGKVDMVDFVKTTFNPKLEIRKPADLAERFEQQKKQTTDFFLQFDDYISSKRNKVTEGMTKVYTNVKKILLAFQDYRTRPITFEEIDFNFYEELVDYLLFEHLQMRKKVDVKGLKMSTAGKVIKQLRIFLRNRMRKKIIPPIDLEDFKILDEECDAIYLNETEIDKILNADLSGSPHLEKYRYMLVFGCLTGLRFSDFSSIRRSDIREGRLHKKQGKSDHWVVIPLRDEARNILLNVFDGQFPAMTNADFNYYIKEVGKKAKIDQQITFSYKKGNKDIVETKCKYGWITSHTCRRSFCTNEFLAGTPVELIMKISGHKSTRDFYKYIRISPEQAAMQVEKIWQDRKKVPVTIKAV
jgi:integrase